MQKSVQEAAHDWAANLYDVHNELVRLQGAIRQNQLHKAEEILEQAQLSVQQVLLSFERYGIAVPSFVAASRPSLSKELLSSEANRKFASTLEKAFDAASEVDAERGYSSNHWVHLIFEVMASVQKEIEHGEGDEHDAKA